MVRQIQLIGERWFFDMALQSRPAWIPILASDCELRVTEAYFGVEDLGVAGLIPARMKFSEPLGHSWVAVSVIPEQIFRLIPQVIEVGIRWETFYRHDELPFVSPRSAFTGGK